MNMKKYRIRRIPRLLAGATSIIVLSGLLAVTAFAAAVDFSKDGAASITIHHKGLNATELDLYENSGTTTPAPGTALPGSNVVFDDGSTDYELGNLSPMANVVYTLELVETTNEGSLDPDDYTPVSGFTLRTGTTDGNGEYKFDNLAFGIYRVSEDSGSVEPFLVNVPLRDPITDDWIYDVHVYPKSELAPGMYIQKKQSSVLGNRVNWTVTVGLPGDLETGGPLVITDDFTPGLKLLSHKVYYLAKDGTKTLLTDSVEYTATLPAPPLDNRLVITIAKGTPAEALALLMASDGTSGTDGPAIFLELDTLVTKDFDHTAALSNTASYTYTDSSNNNTGDEDNGEDGGGKTETPFAEIDVVAYEGNGTSVPIAGVSFKIYTALDGSGNPITPIQAEAGGDQVYTTGSPDGKIIDPIKLHALAAPGKEYYIVVTEVPAGMALPTNYVSFTAVELGSKLVELHIQKAFVLPATGGPGAVLITLGGVLLAVISIPFFVAGKRRKKKDSE